MTRSLEPQEVLAPHTTLCGVTQTHTSQRECQCLLILLFVSVELESHSVSQAGFELTSTLPAFVFHKYWIMGMNQHIWSVYVIVFSNVIRKSFLLKTPSDIFWLTEPRFSSEEEE